jgi:hypothetical protein
MQASTRRHRSWPLAILSATLIALAASGCSGPQGAGSGNVVPTAATGATHVLSSSRAATLPSQLLFVPTGSESINIYALKNPNQQGPLASISYGLAGEQYQMTTDSAGDLFVVNDNFTKLNEQYVSVYAPPYSGSPTMLTGVEFPLGVAVDAQGTVYVSNCGSYCSQTPAVYVYSNGATTPTGTITSSGFRDLGGLALDNAGNLYIANSNRATGASDVFEVPAGSSTAQPLHLKGLFNIGGPGIGKVMVD